MDLISERQLGLVITATRGNAVFQDIYISAVWRGDLSSIGARNSTTRTVTGCSHQSIVQAWRELIS